MKKGFTLIELLAVLIVLAAIIVIVVPVVNSVIKSSKSSLTQTQITSIEKAAKQYYLLEGMDTNSSCVNLEDLIEKEYLDTDKILNLSNNESLNGSVKIIYENGNYIYKYMESSCPICSPIIGDGTSIGDKIECEVKPGTKYNFYVLSFTSNDMVNLIMDRNINSDGTPTTKAIAESEAFSNGGIYNLVTWASQEDYNDDVNWGSDGNNNKGPITAMNYLYNATKNWDNVPNIIMNYEDEGNTGLYGYGKIVTENNITKITMKDETTTNSYINLKARMPYYSEVGYPNNSTKHLYEYLQGGVWYYDESTKPLNNISGIYGYWTLSSYYEHISSAWLVHAFGTVSHDNYVTNGSIMGVRPVISVAKNNIK